MSRPPRPQPVSTGSSLPYWQVPGERPGNAKTRQWFHAERWEMERQRLGIRSARPTPPFREATVVGEIVQGLVEKLGLGGDVAIDTLRARWAEIVGEDLARHCRPDTLENGTLAIAVKGAVWMFELRRAQGRLLAAVRATPAGRDVSRLSFRPDAGGGETR